MLACFSTIQTAETSPWPCTIYGDVTRLAAIEAHVVHIHSTIIFIWIKTLLSHILPSNSYAFSLTCFGVLINLIYSSYVRNLLYSVTGQIFSLFVKRYICTMPFRAENDFWEFLMAKFSIPTTDTVRTNEINDACKSRWRQFLARFLRCVGCHSCHSCLRVARCVQWSMCFHADFADFVGSLLLVDHTNSTKTCACEYIFLFNSLQCSLHHLFNQAIVIWKIYNLNFLSSLCLEWLCIVRRFSCQMAHAYLTRMSSRLVDVSSYVCLCIDAAYCQWHITP